MKYTDLSGKIFGKLTVLCRQSYVNHYIKYKGDYITAREFWEKTGKKSSYSTCLKFVKMIKYFKELGYAINTD